MAAQETVALFVRVQIPLATLVFLSLLAIKKYPEVCEENFARNFQAVYTRGENRYTPFEEKFREKSSKVERIEAMIAPSDYGFLKLRAGSRVRALISPRLWPEQSFSWTACKISPKCSISFLEYRNMTKFA